MRVVTNSDPCRPSHLDRKDRCLRVLGLYERHVALIKMGACLGTERVHMIMFGCDPLGFTRCEREELAMSDAQLEVLTLDH